MGKPNIWSEQDAALEQAGSIADRGRAAIIEADGRVVEVALPPAGPERQEYLRKQLGGDFVDIRPARLGWDHRPLRTMVVRRDASEEVPLNTCAVRTSIGARGRVVLFDRE